MFNIVKKKIIGILLAVSAAVICTIPAAAAASEVTGLNQSSDNGFTPYTSEVKEGGFWGHGCSGVELASDYQHHERNHHSSCQGAGNLEHSDWVPPHQQANSSTTWCAWKKSYTYYDVR